MKSHRLVTAAWILAAAVCAPMTAAAQSPWAGSVAVLPVASAAQLHQLMAWERQDMGVAAPEELHGGPARAPTPNRLPGGQIITTKGLLPLLQSGMVLVFDVRGPSPALPGAQPLAWAGQAGRFDDDTQQALAQTLRQATQGRREQPLVFHGEGPHCWRSYNAALRAVQLGYRNVLWYRGGVQAWQQAVVTPQDAGS